MITFDPERALAVYRGNVENFDEAAPMLTFIGDEDITPILLDLPDDAPELVGPQAILGARRLHPLPIRQAVLSVEAEVMSMNKPFAGTRLAVIIYSAGGQEDYRMIAPFRRVGSEVLWLATEFEAVIGPVLDKDPIIAALRAVLT